LSLICPHCGGAILAQIDLKPDESVASNPAQFPTVEPELSKTEVRDQKVYNQGYEPAFLDFWDVYPLHRGKRKAQIAWLKSVKRLAQLNASNSAQAQAQILAAAIRYRDDPNRSAQFTKYAEGWLNGDRWEDEALPLRESNGHDRESAATRLLREAGMLGGS